GIVGAHDALQLRELANHVRVEVGLGKQGGAVCQPRVGIELFGNVCRNAADALDTLQHGAQLVVIDAGGQLRHSFGERRAPIGLEEKPRIGKARPHYTLVALNDVYRIAHLHVADDQEPVCQLAGFRLEQGEILLVEPHSENEALGRNSQEFRFEFAYVDGGVLDQSSDFIKQGVDFGALADGGAQAIGLIMQLAQDVGAAAFEARHDAPLLQQYRFVLVGRGDLEYA